MKKIVLALFLVFLGSAQGWSRAGELRRIYEPAMTPSDQQALSEIKRSGVVSEITRFVNNEFILPDNLHIRLGARRGPLFDNQYGEIDIPYSFITTTRESFAAAWPNKSKDEIFNATMDVLMHVLMHEMGHALLDLYGIPAIRNEENEVDDLAAILLVEMFEDGGKIVLSAAKAFDLQSAREEVYGRAYMGTEHGQSIERFRNMACLVYGSNPKTHPELLENTGLTQDDAEECTRRYKMRRAYWFDTLGPNMRNSKRARTSSKLGKDSGKGFWGSVGSTLDKIFDRN